MDQSIQFTHAMSNFNSVYNVTPTFAHHSTMRMPMSSSVPCRSRSISPPVRSFDTKFNLDLYHPNEYRPQSTDYPSPSSSVIIHHHPVYSPPPSQALSKLRLINDEISRTLAQCELTPRPPPRPMLPPPALPPPPPSPPHYHIHHYPVQYNTHRSRSPSEHYSSSVSSSASSLVEPAPVRKKHNAKMTFKAHIPRRYHSSSNLDQLLVATSDVYSSVDPMTVDLYPTRDQGYVRKVRNRPDNEAPWLPTTPPPMRRNSFSEASTYRTPRAPNYSNKLIQPNTRLITGKERSRSSSVKPRARPESAPNELRRSAVSFSSTAPVWRPGGTIKYPKHMGSHAPPTKDKVKSEPPWYPNTVAKKTKHFRAFEPNYKPTAPKAQERVWHPSSKAVTQKHTEYFEPTLKPELTAPVRKEKTEATVKPAKVKNQPKVSSVNPELKSRIANAESKVKSAWTLSAPAQEKKPPVARPPTKVTQNRPPKSKPKVTSSKPVVPSTRSKAAAAAVNTGRSSVTDIPAEPQFQSTPKNQSFADNNEDVFFPQDSDRSNDLGKEIIPPARQTEKTPTKLPSTSALGSNKKPGSIQKDSGAKNKNDDNRFRADAFTPSPAATIKKNDDEEEEVSNKISTKPPPVVPERKALSSKADNKDNVSIVDDEDEIVPNASDQDDTDQDAEQSLEMNKSANAATKATTNTSQINDAVSSAADPQTSPKAQTRTPPSKTMRSPSPPADPSDEGSPRSPIISAKDDQKPPVDSSPRNDGDYEDFFS